MRKARVLKETVTVHGNTLDVNFYTNAKKIEGSRTSHLYNHVEIIKENFIYGVNSIIRGYVDWPDSKPLPITIQTGHSRQPKMWQMPYDAILDDFWLWGDREEEVHTKFEEPWLKKGTNCYSNFPVRNKNQKFWKLGCPYIYLPKLDIPRKGTIVFPKGNHLGDKLSRMGLAEVCETLKKLPAKFKPITVVLRLESLFKTHQHKLVEDAGLNWVCLGAPNHPGHATSLQHLFASHEYATTDYPGSPRHLALYFGCKFFYLHRDIPGYGKRAIQAYYISENGAFKGQSHHEYINDEFEHFNIDTLDEVLKSDYTKKVLNRDMGIEYKKTPGQLKKILFKLAENEVYQYFVETLESLYTDDQIKPKNDLCVIFKREIMRENWKWLIKHKFLHMEHEDDYGPEWLRTWRMLAKIRYQYLSYLWKGSQSTLGFKAPEWVFDAQK